MAPDGKRRSEAQAADAAKRPRPEPKVRDGSVGKALRSAYQLTVSEQVPDDLLDLLGKLD